jgi:hypothetical protein
MIDRLRPNLILLLCVLMLSGALPMAHAESGVAKIPFVIEAASPFGTVEDRG